MNKTTTENLTFTPIRSWVPLRIAVKEMLSSPGNLPYPSDSYALVSYALGLRGKPDLAGRRSLTADPRLWLTFGRGPRSDRRARRLLLLVDRVKTLASLVQS